MGLPLEPAATWSGAAAGASLTVDALFGTGLDRDLGEPAIRLIRALNGLAIPILAVDLPSGLDADTGLPRPEAIRATVTATMVAPKVGLLAPGAAAFTGRVETVAIGGPPPAVDREGTA
jgi:NAD(P)H-hydrate epimerase